MRIVELDSARCRIASDFFGRAMGLLGRNCLDPEEFMVLMRCRAVHTIGMRFPIDILFFSKRLVLVRIIEGLPAWRIAYCARAFGVLETNAGWATKNRVRVGDRLVWRRTLG